MIMQKPKETPAEYSQERQFLLERLAGDNPGKKRALMDYWFEIDEGITKREKEEAQDIIKELIQSGIRPIITVPKTYAEETEKKGLSARETWIPGLKILTGTLGAPFYRMEDRVAFEVDSKPNDLIPRFTGQDKKFHGVVVFKKGSISANKLHRIEF